MKYEVGPAAYIAKNNHIVREVAIVNREDGFYTVWFEDGRGDVRLKEHRFFPTQGEVEANIH